MNSGNVKALLFDLNGTMIDDMDYHARGWFDILNDDLGAGMSWDEVKSQMYGKNAEVLSRIFGDNRFSASKIEALSNEKELRYQKAYFPNLSLIEGLETFLQKAKEAKMALAIGSAAIPFNINFVLDNLNIRHFFDAVVSADDVVESKPHPETYIKCADLLDVDPASCIVFEDAPKGVEAAYNAGMRTVVITTMHPKEDFVKYPNVIHFINDYKDPFLYELIK